MMLTDEASPFLVHEDGRTLRIGWDNRRVRKDNAVFWIFLVFWFVWAPLTVLVSCASLLPGIDTWLRIFFVIWSIFGWLGTLLIPYSVIGRTWSEWIEIS